MSEHVKESFTKEGMKKKKEGIPAGRQQQPDLAKHISVGWKGKLNVFGALTSKLLVPTNIARPGYPRKWAEKDGVGR